MNYQLHKEKDLRCKIKEAVKLFDINYTILAKETGRT